MGGGNAFNQEREEKEDGRDGNPGDLRISKGR